MRKKSPKGLSSDVSSVGDRVDKDKQGGWCLFAKGLDLSGMWYEEGLGGLPRPFLTL